MGNECTPDFLENSIQSILFESFQNEISKPLKNVASFSVDVIKNNKTKNQKRNSIIKNWEDIPSSVKKLPKTKEFLSFFKCQPSIRTNKISPDEVVDIKTENGKIMINFTKRVNFVGEKKSENSANGIIKFANGDTYFGDIRNCTLEGNGEYVFADKKSYKGQFEMGRKSGIGEEKFLNGDRFKGAFQFDKRNGKGVYFWGSGETYEGLFKNDKASGNGRLTFEKGYYLGEFDNGEITGNGVFKYGDNEIYCGTFKNNMREGSGKLFFKKEEVVFGGCFVKDKSAGKSSLVLNNKEIFEVCFEEEEMVVWSIKREEMVYDVRENRMMGVLNQV